MNEENYPPQNEPYGEQEQYQQPPPPPQQQQQPQQQYPQHQGYQPPPEKKSNKSLLIIIGVIAVVGILVLASYFILFAGREDIVGEWKYTEEIEGWEFSITMIFNADGTGEIRSDDMGEEYSEDFTWEKTGSGEITVTSNGDTETIEYDIRDNGNTLVFLDDVFGEEVEFERQ